ncbi:MAG TPA: AAA family ATPase [Tepidisphaeraceae bacterium]|nr:AAA family ATPase [Tepidisphaeraceae bacterium]
MEEQFGAELPADLDAEMSLLGSILIDRNQLAPVREIVDRVDFFDGAHCIIFDSITVLADEGAEIDSVTVRRHLKDRGCYEEVGGDAYLAKLLDKVPSAAHAIHYARILRGKTKLREMIDIGNDLIRIGHKPYLGDADVMIQRARDRVDELARQETDGEKYGLLLTRFSDVQSRPVEWLWPERFALGKVSLIAGDPGLGKSFLTVFMGAVVSNGGLWPDCTERIERGSVIMLNAEDDLEDTIRPRLDAAGADVSRIVALRGVARPAINGKSIVHGFTLNELPMLEDAIKATPDVKLIIIDPISAYLDDADSHRNAEIRGLLAPLAELAAKYHVAIVLVTHLNKGGGGKALHRAMGSLAFVAAARAAWLVTADKADPRRRLLLPMKNNLGNDTSGLAYTIIGDGQGAAVAFERGAVSMKADDALRDDEDEDRRGPAPETHNAAVEWLTELLGAGPLESGRVKSDAKEAGLMWATIRRAQQTLGIKPYKAQFGGAWMWTLPPPKSTCSSTCSRSPIPEQPEQLEQLEHLRFPDP